MPNKNQLLDEHLAELPPQQRRYAWWISLLLGGLGGGIGYVCVQFRPYFEGVHYETIVGLLLVIGINIFWLRQVMKTRQQYYWWAYAFHTLWLWLGFGIGWTVGHGRAFGDFVGLAVAYAIGGILVGWLVLRATQKTTLK